MDANPQNAQMLGNYVDVIRACGGLMIQREVCDPMKIVVSAAKRSARGFGLIGMIVSTFVSLSSQVNAATTCPVPFLAQGESANVDGTTVTATSSTAEYGGVAGRYLHRPPGSFDTTWTFSPAISSIDFETLNHADGVGADEKYAFTAKDGSGNTVQTFDIIDFDGTTPITFSSPVTTLVTTYTPTSGVYGSYLFLNLSAGADSLCINSTAATVRAPSGSMTAGSTPPTLTPTAFVTGSNPETPVSFDTAPTCVLEDGNSNEVELSSSTPPGVYTVVCTGGSADGYTFGTYLEGEFVVEDAGEYEFYVPRKWWDALHSQELPHTL